MNSPAGSGLLFEAVSGMLVFISLLTAAFCIASLRSHVDEAKIRKEENLSSLFRFPIPPEHVLTPVGARRVKIAKVAIAVCFVTVAVIVAKIQILSV